MIPFIVIAVVMTAIALAWVVVPLMRRQRGIAVARETSNLTILRDQLQELERDLADGAITRMQYDEARQELEARALEESQPQERTAPSRVGRRTVWAIAAVVPVAALALYAAWGNFDAFAPIARVDSSQRGMSREQVNDMVGRLAARLEKEPNNVEGFTILARSYYALGRYPEAARAFEHLATLTPNRPDVLVDYADALAATQQSLQGKPIELVTQALKLDPGNWKGLALAGTAAFDRADYKEAVAYWEKLKQVLPSDSPMSKSVEASIAEARQLGALRGEPVAASNGAAAGTTASRSAGTPTAVGVNANRVEGTVALSPAVAAQARPDDVVFIFARAVEGPRMPLAIIKRTVKELPATFTLDDSTAMTPNMTLSSYAQIMVGARVSKSGNAIPRPGDLEGYSPPVKAGATGLHVVIDRVVQ